MDKEEARKRISELVSKWKKYESEGRLRSISEADTKSSFIEPLFESLGWSVRDLDEVSREEAVSRKRVDYAFRLSGVVRFFLEAKAASIPLEEKEAAQATHYSYYKSVPWAVLTNFGQLVVYDCEREYLSESRFLNFTADSYLSDFDRLWLLRKEGIASGEFERFAQSVGKGKKREPLTKKLFSDFRQWRGMLSRNIAEHSRLNKLETKELLDEGVQKLLNRLVFIRSCEDRGFENQRLREAVRTWHTENKRKLLKYVVDVFDDFNDAYDSDLFSPHFASSLHIDDSVMEEVVDELYKYEFGIIDADVLGNVYEQYLATLMREGGGLRESGSIRKEMGIYYTPTYIVDYIVKNTLGELISKAKSHSDLEKIKVLDPACGSGSFLIRAYETLNDAYSKKNGGDYETLEGNVSRNANTILTKNIYGVDLDRKAVEIAELNLLLRAARRRGMLPPLYENVKCGNSLISGTPEEMEKYFGKSWKEKKPFNWEEKFADVMKNGGFDVVIGNPPYVNIYLLSKNEEEVKYYQDRFESAYKKFDLYVLFIERGIKLLKNGGYLSFIVPDKFLSQPYGSELRKLILNTCCIEKIVNLTNFKIFADATVDNVIVVLRKEQTGGLRNKHKIRLIIPKEDPSKAGTISEETKTISQALYLTMPENTFRLDVDANKLKLKDKIDSESKYISEICYVNWGARSGDIETFVVKEKKNSLCKQMLDARDIDRYQLIWDGKYLIYDKKKLYNPMFEELFENEKLIIRDVNAKEGIKATFDNRHYYTEHTVSLCLLNYQLTGVERRGLRLTEEQIDLSKKFNLKYLLAIINSKLITFYFLTFIGTGLHVYPDNVRALPIHLASESEQQPIIKLVDKMLDLNKCLSEIGETQSTERHELEQEIKRTDEKIDELVYKLYGITEEERKVIEASFQ